MIERATRRPCFNRDLRSTLAFSEAASGHTRVYHKPHTGTDPATGAMSIGLWETYLALYLVSVRHPRYLQLRATHCCHFHGPAALYSVHRALRSTDCLVVPDFVRRTRRELLRCIRRLRSWRVSLPGRPWHPCYSNAQDTPSDPTRTSIACIPLENRINRTPTSWCATHVARGDVTVSLAACI